MVVCYLGWPPINHTFLYSCPYIVLSLTMALAMWIALVARKHDTSRSSISPCMNSATWMITANTTWSRVTVQSVHGIMTVNTCRFKWLSLGVDCNAAVDNWFSPYQLQRLESWSCYCWRQGFIKRMWGGGTEALKNWWSFTELELHSSPLKLYDTVPAMM